MSKRRSPGARPVQQSQPQRGVLTHIPAWAGTEDACLRDERRRAWAGRGYPLLASTS
jgi:hypothetical protein